MWVHTCKGVGPGLERPYKSGPSLVVPQPIFAMNRAELPVTETKPHGLKPHICCPPPPCAPTLLSSTPLLVRAEPRRGVARPNQPADSDLCSEDRGRDGPREPTDLYPSEAASDSSWLSADESSGYESESAGGERTVAAGESRGRQRRARTAFTSEQVCRLEKTFQRQKYLGASERRKLAAALHLSEVQIKTWFQNRRMKLKRQIQDQQHSLMSSAPLYSYPTGSPPALFQDGLHYPFAPQHQKILPFTTVPAVQFSFSFPRYDASQSGYHFMANEMSYYHHHFLPHPSFLPVSQSKMDKQCHPVYAL